MNPVDDEEMTPAEIQAQANSAKITKFIGGIGWQCMIMLIVVYTTIFANTAAEFLLGAYAWFMIVALLGFFFTVCKSFEKLATQLPKHKDLLVNTPTSNICLALGTTFSCIEVTLLITHGWFWIAALWTVTEIFQHTAIWKLRRVAKYAENPNVQVAKAFTTDPKFGEMVCTDLDKFTEVLKEIDTLIENVKLETQLSESEIDDLVTKLQAQRVLAEDALIAYMRQASLKLMKDLEDKE